MTVPAAPDPNDEGMILPLVLVFVMIALSLVIVVVDITAVHIQRNRLYALADAAALDAADAIDSGGFYDQGGLVQIGPAQPIPLTDASVRQSVRDYLPGALPEPSELPDVAVGAPTGSPAPGTAEVTLTARARLPIFGFVVTVWQDGVPLDVTVQAQARNPG